MKKQTAHLTLSAITAALITAVMLCSYFPFLTFAVPALSGALIIMVLVESGKGYAIASFLVSAFLVLLFSEPEAKLMYVCFFGYYPIVKAVFEKIKSRVLEYLLKFITFNGAVTLVYLVLADIFMIEQEGFGDFGKYSFLILYALGNLAFILYDTCLTKLSVFYMVRRQNESIVRRSAICSVDSPEKINLHLRLLVKVCGEYLLGAGASKVRRAKSPGGICAAVGDKR